MAVIEFTPEGRILDANKNFLNAMEYDLSSIEGQHHKIFVSDEESQSADYKRFWQDLGTGHLNKGIFDRYSSSGKKIRLNAIYTPITDDKGVVQKVVKLATVLQ
jgi:methyl-accepting chemotaxis protein